ncbi:MAG: Gfo/Idh/MocA family oxidoreductase [Clostridia bacterium]|nr:Gfo/Idh/MocA family oxidoreductase [Clostridia bacterium]
MADKLRIGIIGTGGIAHSHANAYKSFDDVEVVAGADIIPGKARAFLDRFGWTDATAYDDCESLCARDDIDAVSICTYNTQHACCAIAALESGKHVLLEKPMCVTLAEGIEIMKAEKKSGKILTVGFQPRYNNNCRKIKRIVDSGELGKVYYVQIGGSRRRGIPGSTFIDADKAAFGAIGDLGCYSLDLSLNSIGYPKPLTVSAYTSDYFGKNPKYYGEADRFSVDDFSAAFIRLEGDIILDYRMAWAMHMDICSDFVILGTDAGLKATAPHPNPLWGSIISGDISGLYIMHDKGGEPVTTQLSLEKTDYNIFTMKVRDFVDAVKKGGKAPIPTSQIIYNQAIIDAMVTSAKEHCEIKIDIPEI